MVFKGFQGLWEFMSVHCNFRRFQSLISSRSVSKGTRGVPEVFQGVLDSLQGSLWRFRGVPRSFMSGPWGFPWVSHGASEGTRGVLEVFKGFQVHSRVLQGVSESYGRFQRTSGACHEAS